MCTSDLLNSNKHTETIHLTTPEHHIIVFTDQFFPLFHCKKTKSYDYDIEFSYVNNLRGNHWITGTKTYFSL